jgi:pilus assembly protein CpaC
MSIYRLFRQKITYRVLVTILAVGATLVPRCAIHAQAHMGLSVSSVGVSPVTTNHVARLSEAKASLSNRSEVSNQPLHVLVGRSIFLMTQGRLKRVYVSNPLVLDSFTSSPTQIVVTAKAPGVSSLILWDEVGESQTYLVSSDLDVSSLQNEIHEALPYDEVTVEAQQDRISLSGTVLSDVSVETATKLASLYAKSVVNSLVVRPAHPRQVRLKVQMIEIDRSKLDQFGINFLSSGKNSSGITTGQFPTTSTYTPPSGTTPAKLDVSDALNLFFYNFDLTSGVTIRDLQNKQILQILAEPTITTLSGQKASFLSGGEFPFPVVQGSSGGATSITIQFRSFGVKLDFTPVVNPDGTIQLKVSPEVSALDFTNAVTISGYTIPALSTRRADTQVELRDGQSFAISGLLDNRTTDLLSKTPGIGDIPILGHLFRSKNINHSVVELMVIVTPTVVNPLTDETAPNLPKFPVPMLDPAQFDKAGPKTLDPTSANPAGQKTGGKQ